ncbi:MAG: hypothetical protein M1838_000232 [Thelocarpon superellum]|nr:MAG: hypothetical protein M1838_000232 [Thelocarpon superellum]
MTASDPAAATMSIPNLDLPPSSLRRPSVPQNKSSLSLQSSSVPSTPKQHARQLSLKSRSPSPEGFNHSPRSTHSESNSHLPPLRRPPVGCRFETGMAFSKRRIPYSIGTDRLRKAEVPPKRVLAPAEEEKLSADMRNLYHDLLPSTESEGRRTQFVHKLERILNEQWPGSDIKVHVFGSSGNLLCTSESDVDICITTPLRDLEQVCMLANALANHGMERVVCVPSAKVPIVKFWDPDLRLACDMNVNNTLALENTRMVKLYVEIDERVRPLAMILKHWTKRRVLNDAALGGTLSSYTWICMIINFLQTREPPILPSLHHHPRPKRGVQSQETSAFADDLETLTDFGKPNPESLGSLLYHFFCYYGHEIDYDTAVVSVRQGKVISKEAKGWHLMQNNSLCVEEPFNVSRNLGNTADETAFRGLHLELRRACACLENDADLERCCEQYIFPAEEERVWEKPPPQPKPVLSRTGSQTPSTRAARPGGGGTRGRHLNNQAYRGGSGNRRSSSSASLNGPPPLAVSQPHQPHPPLPPQPPHPPHQSHQALPIQDAYRHSPQLQAQLQLHLQDRLFHDYQILQAREAELRVRQAHAQAIAQAQARGDVSAATSVPMPTLAYLNGPFTAYSTSLENPPATAPLRPDLYMYSLPHHAAPSFFSPGTSTNPSSPSITPVLPELRRTLRRTPIADGSATGSLRSQSQPARPLASSLSAQGNIAAVNGLGLHATPQLQQYETRIVPNAGLDVQGGQMRDVSRGTSPQDEGTPKEYLGYYVGGSPPLQQHYGESLLQPVPTFGDLTGRRRRSSAKQVLLDRLRLGSRSPSPTERIPTVSSEPVVADGGGSAGRSNEPVSVDRSCQDHGPLIVDGSTSSVPVEVHQPQAYMSESASTSDDLNSDTPATTAEPAYLEPAEEERAAGEIRKQGDVALDIPGDDFPPPATMVGIPTVPTSLSEALRRGSGTQTAESPSVQPMTPTLLPPLDIASSDQAAMAPVLSPVYETQTPSPTGRRKVESPNEAKNHSLRKSPKDQGSRELQPPPTPAAGANSFKESRSAAETSNGLDKAVTNPIGATNGWKAAGKGRKTRSGGKKGSGSSIAAGEMPLVGEMERKGG